ncbi:MAG TPA: type IV pilin, partial [Methanosarcinaceae archaeon]|nr:type IV pilin [Methanosarcinaceae archaeon]
MFHKNGHCKDVKNINNRHPSSKYNVSLFLDKRGVSDVVGNILMVAITVI